MQSCYYSYHAVHYILGTYFVTGSLYLLTTFAHFTPCLWQPPVYFCAYKWKPFS